MRTNTQTHKLANNHITHSQPRRLVDEKAHLKLVLNLGTSLGRQSDSDSGLSEAEYQSGGGQHTPIYIYIYVYIYIYIYTHMYSYLYIHIL